MPLRPCALALAFALALQSSPVPGMAAATEVVMGAECGHIRNGTALARDTCPGPGACKVVSAEGEDDVMKCVHKALFPLDGSDIAALFLVFVSTALAAGGGIGGGGLLVPIYILVNSFETSQATALSLATISGGSIANLWTYMQARRRRRAVIARRLWLWLWLWLWRSPTLRTRKRVSRECVERRVRRRPIDYPARPSESLRVCPARDVATRTVAAASV